MIQFNMITKDKHVSEGIADMMLRGKYTTDLRLEEMVQLEWDEDSQSKKEVVFFRVTCIMRSLLFATLVHEVTEVYGPEPRMFSFPVIQIEEDWANEVRQKTRKN
ncbi:MAG TPA: hypothetical protein DEP18_07925 [Flavobacteriales bacterium]|nr:hypothetical protein [Flavobacteriales bacterium]HRE76136.1 hypothetical protein [Flavobacteriales bacterium]HRE95942.1 hypothetical protein [Flavobacteriales bacterium]HRJ38185.1 hypothetical protein [Flavobacteriales bacterium]